MSKWNLIIDVARCNNCNNCLLATKDEYVGNNFPGYSATHDKQGTGVLQIERTVRGSGTQVEAAYLPLMCNHCDNAPCVRAGNGAVTKRHDGIVIIDPIKAKGRRDLVDSCPYGAIVWNEAEQLPQQWIFDAHLLDANWPQPRCAQACPTHAIEAVKLSDADMQQRATREQLRPLRPELGTHPRVHYRNLHRIDRCFIAGTVLYRNAGNIECCADAVVTLHHDHQLLGTTHSNAFGEFKFDGLAAVKNEYLLEITHPHAGHACQIAVLNGESRVLNDIFLSSK